MRIILAFSVVVLSFFSFAQKIDSRLYNSYSKEELSNLKQTDLDKILLLNYALGNALYIIDLPIGKLDELDGTIILPMGEYNFTDLGIKLSNKNQYYRISETEKMLVVKSEWVLTNEISKK